MAYIGKQPVIGNFVKLDAISVVNGQASYTMQNGGANFTEYANVNQFLVSLNGILQSPTDSFTVSGSTITFASNLVTGDVIDFIIVLGNTLDVGVPSDNTVSTAKIVDGAITSGKLASGVGGKLLQVVTATDSTSRSTTSTSFVTASNTLSLSITPSSASSKIFITYSSNGYKNGNNEFSYVTIFRDATNLGDSNSGLNALFVGADDIAVPFAGSILDSPNTTSAITYEIRIRTNAGTFFLNYPGTGQVKASITAFEIGA